VSIASNRTLIIVKKTRQVLLCRNHDHLENDFLLPFFQDPEMCVLYNSDKKGTFLTAKEKLKTTAWRHITCF
jgi:hypothetical protein